jgi:hypothetical protein
LAHNSTKKATEIARRGPKFPLGTKLGAFTVTKWSKIGYYSYNRNTSLGGNMGQELAEKQIKSLSNSPEEK